MIDKNRFRKNLTGLGELFDREVTDSLASLYWRLFAGWSDDQFETACNQAARTLKFWPKPAELQDAVGTDKEAEALEAWETLQKAIRRVGQYESVTFTDPKIARVVEMLGGWEAVCIWETSELSYRRHEFLRIYQILKGDSGLPKTLLGLIACGNAARGFVDHIPEPVVVGDEKPKQIEASKKEKGAVIESDRAETQS